ncbi:hypothetical protein UCRPA7_4778 [Phaeoacremonium minimum UCRPA7]|uniref:CMP/dCMP-type deaminase domain-containing protein n=1 Tax=Phaeoacremonium minimum (strain UCR-PA7) TaxID=1286976 RepID=R8BK83_PHAM7|nr:hypothetical protein UCRPA7_4778 [Phaeoacremonium minimum UCRPA7]EON99721.1 hypothetical protein UCRPA7_4778 [Phaeoacremonium minimum UCRPA7]
MKSDYYLNLCLEQAALSPLHFRHGCVVVKGGKVIGQGFNDYRPGYDGGALKTGRLSSRASPLASDAHSRTKNPPGAKRDFTAFETVGGTTRGAGPHGTVGLSMHSEMMAIHSALASSSTLAASTVSYIKPSLKLPGDYKHKLRDAVRSYTERVCLEAVGQHVQQASTKLAENYITVTY